MLRDASEDRSRKRAVAAGADDGHVRVDLPGDLGDEVGHAVRSRGGDLQRRRDAAVSVVLTRRDGGIGALIEDDGRGFAEGEVSDDALGLVGMRERLGLLDGTLTVESSPGGGTALAAYVPL
jgi:LytS/YehU family sensor histidine kinase